jgi:hypothetical protein
VRWAGSVIPPSVVVATIYDSRRREFCQQRRFVLLAGGVLSILQSPSRPSESNRDVGTAPLPSRGANSGSFVLDKEPVCGEPRRTHGPNPGQGQPERHCAHPTWRLGQNGSNHRPRHQVQIVGSRVIKRHCIVGGLAWGWW